MKRLVVWVGGSVFLFLFFGLVSLYQNGGLKSYVRATMYLRGLTAQDKQIANDAFYGAAGPPNSYNGILAGAWGGRVWVWHGVFLGGYQIQADGGKPQNYLNLHRTRLCFSHQNSVFTQLTGRKWHRSIRIFFLKFFILISGKSF